MTAVPTTPLPVRRGACPGVVDAMESGDGWLLRVRLPGGRLPTARLRVLADVAAAFGSGTVEITSRANLQVRGVPGSALVEAAERLVAAGLADADPDADALRAVVASPLAGHDPSELVDVSPLVDAVLASLGAADITARLPAKFGVVIDGGGGCGVRDVPGDVCLGAVLGTDGTIEWELAVGGPLSASPVHVVGVADEATLVGIVDAVARRCVAEGRRAMDADVAALLSLRSTTAGSVHHYLSPHPAVATGPAAHEPDASRRPSTAGSHDAHSSPHPAVGLVGHVDDALCNVVAQAFLGRVDAAVLEAIADLADSIDPDRDVLRTTPAGGMALTGVGRSDAARVVERLAALGLIVDADDPRLGITACIGRPGCASARADTVAAASELSNRGHDRPQRIHLSACEKRCGAPAHSPVVVADDHGHFDLAGATW